MLHSLLHYSKKFRLVLKSCVARSAFEERFINCVTDGENTQEPYNNFWCRFRALALNLRVNERLVLETSNLFNLFRENFSGTDSANFRAVCLDDIATVENIVRADTFLFGFDVFHGSMFGKLARRSLGKTSKNVGLLRYTSHICNAPIWTLPWKPIVVHLVKNSEPWATCGNSQQKT